VAQLSDAINLRSRKVFLLRREQLRFIFDRNANRNQEADRLDTIEIVIERIA
jgi:hypothetical protein